VRVRQRLGQPRPSQQTASTKLMSARRSRSRRREVEHRLVAHCASMSSRIACRSTPMGRACQRPHDPFQVGARHEFHAQQTKPMLGVNRLGEDVDDVLVLQGREVRASLS